MTQPATNPEPESDERYNEAVERFEQLDRASDAIEAGTDPVDALAELNENEST